MSPKDSLTRLSVAAKGGGHQLAAKDLLTGNSLIVSLQGERERVAWDLSFGKYVGSGNP